MEAARQGTALLDALLDALLAAALLSFELRPALTLWRDRRQPLGGGLQLRLHALQGLVHLLEHRFRCHAELAQLGA